MAEVFYCALFTNAISRDFFRAAVFFLITPRFAALSIALYASGSNPIASFLFFASKSFCTSFIDSRMARRRLSLKTRFFREVRSAFFADEVIGIVLGVRC